MSEEVAVPNGWKVKMEAIEGIGPVNAAELRNGGVGSVDALLKMGATRDGRMEVPDATRSTCMQFFMKRTSAASWSASCRPSAR